MSDDSSNLLAALLASPHLALVGAALDGTITTWSCGATELYGWEEAEVLGRPHAMLAPDDRRDEPMAIRESVMRGEDVPAFETVRFAKDGSPVVVELHAFAVRDESGEPVGGLVLYRDLRRAHDAEVALTVSERELHVRFEDSPVPQSRFRLQDRRVSAVNAAMEELLGRDRVTITGQDALLLYAEEDRAGVAATLEQLASGEISHAENERTFLRPDGGRRRVKLSVITVSDSDGSPVLAVSVEDVTALRESEQAARVQADRFETLLQTMPVAVFSYDTDGRCTSVRGQGLRAMGLVDDQLVGSVLSDVYADVPSAGVALERSLAGQAATATVDLFDRTWQCQYQPVTDESGAVTGGLGIAVDVTAVARAEREVRANQARLHALLQHASDVVLVLDVHGRIVYVSPAVREQLGYAETELFWHTSLDFNHPDDRRRAVAGWWQVRAEPGAVVRLEIRFRHADGTWRWADHVLTNLIDDPAVGGVVVNVRETTERRLAEQELRRLAVQDPLTWLANRTLLLDRVGQALAWGQRNDSRTGLVVFDVVGMQDLNERFGHEGGNAVLRTVAERLQSAVRATDSVARIGGDEFAVLFEDIASTEDLRTRAATLLGIAEQPVSVGAHSAAVRLQVGSALCPAVDAGSLLAAAERAVPHERGATGVVVERAAVEIEESLTRSPSADALRQGIARGELRLHYQPVLRLVSGETVGAEALVRWAHPERGLLPPSEFIPLAESSGLIVELGEWVLREACSQAAAWHAAGRKMAVGVNLSPRQLVGAAFPDLVREVLARTGVPPELLVVEVTESALMDDPGAPDVLRTLEQMGVRLALDDFGTGYSSLTYLKRFPVHTIKIDRSFVAGLGRDADDEAIVASVVSLARAVGKLVIAEGVETVGQLDALRAMGVDQAQGYLWSRPVGPAELDAWMDERRRLLPGPLPSPAAPATAAALAVPVDGDAERILALHVEGASLHTIAAALNAEGRRTQAGPRWSPTTVARVLARLVRPGGER